MGRNHQLLSLFNSENVYRLSIPFSDVLNSLLRLLLAESQRDGAPLGSFNIFTWKPLRFFLLYFFFFFLFLKIQPEGSSSSYAQVLLVFRVVMVKEGPPHHSSPFPPLFIPPSLRAVQHIQVLLPHSPVPLRSSSKTHCSCSHSPSRSVSVFPSTTTKHYVL